MISDECPECEANHIDMQALTFNKVSWSYAVAQLLCSAATLHAIHGAEQSHRPSSSQRSDKPRKPCTLQIAPMLNGRIDMQYRRVECTPPMPVNVQIDGNDGTGGWLRLAVTVCSALLARTAVCRLCSAVRSLPATTCRSKRLREISCRSPCCFRIGCAR